MTAKMTPQESTWKMKLIQAGQMTDITNALTRLRNIV